MTKINKFKKKSNKDFKRNKHGGKNTPASSKSSEKSPRNVQNKKNIRNKKHEKGKKFGKKKKDEDLGEFIEVNEESEQTSVKEEDVQSEEEFGDDEELQKKLDKLKTQQNRKNKKSGGFQSMGLSHTVFKGVIRKGYKVPTPIQRKTLPIIMEGKDVVAMARTGSGKTAAFLIPMFEKLHGHSGKAGARALILSPTRELALQTLKFTKELGKFMGLRAAVVLGGDRMDDQFAALHENPDIIIATPGRFMHVVVEMNLKLKAVEYVVFDEADRLFEMGFQEQLNEILARLPDSRQTLLFSATLPKLLVEFAKAGLHDPTLIRLDVDTKLSDQLKLSFFSCRADDKISILLHLLKFVIPKKEQTVIFAATKHHVDYLSLILQKAEISSTYIYSSLDPTARKINIAKFQHRKVSVMIVTDLAARGIDIPLLDNVINLHFPGKPKLFVHRVGRVARAGRTGTAYSLVSPDELAYMYDLHLFLGRPVQPVKIGGPVKDESGLYGRVPQSVMDDMDERLHAWYEEDFDIRSLQKVCTNAYGQYLRSRPSPAQESIKRIKHQEKLGEQIGIHPIFDLKLYRQIDLMERKCCAQEWLLCCLQLDKLIAESSGGEGDSARLNLLSALRNYKTNTFSSILSSDISLETSFQDVSNDILHDRIGQERNEIKPNRRICTIFEVNPSSKTTSFSVMKKKRNFHGDVIQSKHHAMAEHSKRTQEDIRSRLQPTAEDDELQNVFSTVIGGKRANPDQSEASDRKKQKQTRETGKDEDNFISYRPQDYQSEEGLKLGSQFDREAQGAVFDIAGDDSRTSNKSQGALKWDRKKKKFVRESGDTKQKKIKTESGVWIQASYKSNAYKDWVQKTKRDIAMEGAGSDDDDGGNSKKINHGRTERLTVLGGGLTKRKHTKGSSEPGLSNRDKKNKFKSKRTEIRRPEQIVKARKQKAKKEAFQKQRQQQHMKNKAVRGRK